jgi:serine protease Do
MVGACRSFSPYLRAGRFFLPAALLIVQSAVSAQADDKAGKKSSLPSAATKPVPEGVDDLKAIQKQVHSILDKVTPATVSVRIGSASGSGVIVSADGYVLTAGHVSGDANRDCTLILPDGKRIKAKSLGSNKTVDCGLLKITEEGKWPYVEMGRSNDSASGQWCITIGHPGGFKPGRTPVVRLGRILEHTDSFIRTDCTIVGGDSGGPLFDLEGKVIGIHSRIGNPITANIHVPIDAYRDNWDRLVKGEVWPSANAAYMGVELENQGDECRVAKVVEDSPAAKAGLKVDDVILELESKKITSSSELSAQLKNKKPGDQITVKVLRETETLSLKLTLGKRPA